MISGVRISLLLAMSLLLVGTVSAATISDDLHLNLQTTYSNGTIETGTFDFVFNISNTTNCAAGNIVYTNSTTLTTDTRGIISYYLPDVTLDYDIQYYLCYYRDGSLKSSSKIAKTPYSFRAMNITLSGIEVDTNFDMTGYNITADTGFFSWLGNMASRVTKIFVQDIDFSGEITGTGNVSANWFKGQFNWSESSNYLDFDGSQLDFNETKLNETISLIDASSNYWTQSGNNIYYNTGNVGIGTGATPSTPLHIKNATGETQLRIQAAEVGSASTLQFFDSTNAEVAEIYGAADDSLRFQAGNQDILTLESSGYAGLGTTNPDTLFHIKNATGETQLRIQASGVGSAATLQLFDSTNTEIAEIYSAADDSLRFQAGNQDRLTIEDRGYVGIGTSSPGTLLQLENATGDTELRLVPGDATSSGTIQFYNSTNEAAEIYNSWTDDSLRFQTADQDRVTIDNSGQVGIGTASPQNKLNVIGNGNFTGVVYRNEKALIDWSEAMNGTLFLTSQWNATNTSYYLNTNPYAFYNSTSLTMPVIQALNFYNTTETDAQIVSANTSMKGYVDAQDSTYNNSIAAYTNSEDVRYNNSMATYVNALNVSQGSWATNTFAPIAEPLWTANLTAHNSTWTTTDSEIWAVASNDTFVPYTGSNANVVLGNYNFSVGTSDLFVNANTGNVGIGTSSPTAKLNINQDSSATALNVTGGSGGNTLARFYRDIGGSAGLNINMYSDDSQIHFDSPTNDYTIGVDNSASLFGIYRTSNIEANTPDFVIDSDGDVGIGTSSPDTLLHLNSSSPRLKLTDSDTGVDHLLTADSGVGNLALSVDENNEGSDAKFIFSIGGSEKIRVINNGNVGIGTTSPTTKLTINGTGTAAATAPAITLNSNGVGGNHWAGLRFADDGTNKWGIVQDVNADDTNDLSIYDYEGTAVSMYFQTGGNVGIGTASPDNLLEITGSTGSLEINDTDGAASLKLHSSLATPDALGSVQFTGLDDGSALTTYANIIGRVTDDAAVSEDADFEFNQMIAGTLSRAMTIQAGNVGIGTSNPQNLLNVDGDANITGTLYYGSLGTTIDDAFVNVAGDTMTGNLNMSGNNITDVGRLGVGTSNPGSKLDVYTATDMTGGYASQIYNAYSGSAAGSKGLLVRGGANSASGVILEAQDWTGNTDFIVKGDGNVGIGTASPQSKLEVDGDINISRTATNQLILPLNNDASNPTIAFGDGNTGFYEQADNQLVFATGGGNRMLLTTGDFQQGAADRWVLDFANPTATDPNIMPAQSDRDTGVGWSGANQLSLIAGGTEMIRLTNSSSQVDIGGTWQDGGVSISEGTIYATNMNVANISYLNVTHININGSLLPQNGYDNTFDLGNSTDRWNDLYLGGNAYINGSIYEGGTSLANKYYLKNNPFAFYNSTSLTMPVIQALNFYNTTETDAQIVSANTSMKGYVDAKDLSYNNSIAAYTNSEDIRYNNSMATYVNALNVSQGSWATNTFAPIDEPLWTANLTAHNSTWTTTDSEIWAVASNDTFVPYTGSNANVILGNYNFSVGTSDLFVNANTDRVGIGTTNPGTKLEVLGEARVTDYFSAGGTAPSPSFYVEDAGDVGIGTADPTYNLDVVDTTDFVVDVDDAGTTTRIGTGGAYNLSFVTGRDTPSGSTRMTIEDGDGEAIRIDSSSNVGIGTTSPVGNLNINATAPVVRIDSLSGNDAILALRHDAATGNNEQYFLKYDGSANGFALRSSNIDGSNTDGDVITVADGTDDLIIPTGKIGIGTSSPGMKLHINGTNEDQLIIGATANSNSAIFFKEDSAYEWEMYSHGPTDQFRWYSYNLGDNVMVLDDGGSVGIGTTSPSTKLHINSSSYNDHITLQRDAAQFNEITMGGTSQINSKYNLRLLSEGDIEFYAGDAAKMVVGNNGNVGIGTSSPTELLHVLNTESAETGLAIFETTRAGAVGGSMFFKHISATPADEDSLVNFRFYGNDTINDETQYASIFTYSDDVTNGTEDGGMEFFNLVNGVDTSVMRLKNGNVGIGTTPSGRLHIKSSSTSTYPFRITSSDSQNLMVLYEASDTSGELYVYDGSDNSKIKLDSSGSSYFNGGNVGIGTTNPQQKLNVVGDINVTASDNDVSMFMEGGMLVIEG